MNSNEDKITKHLIEWHQSQNHKNPEFEAEPHYNHYGDRGVADLLVKESYESGGSTVRNSLIYEIKSESALKKSTGANEIIRQFKRHCRYFFKDDSRKLRRNSGSGFYLVFEATPMCWEHYKNNHGLYSTLSVDDIEGTNAARLNNLAVGFVDPQLDSIGYWSHPGNFDSATEELEQSEIAPPTVQTVKRLLSDSNLLPSEFVAQPGGGADE